MCKRIPKDTVLLISGVQCVGKTTTAYNIVKNFPDFRRVSELDIIRTIVRAVLTNLSNAEHLDKQILMGEYSELFQSLSESDFKTAKKQSIQLVPYVKEIILRQQSRNIPTIIEGSSIIPSAFFSDSQTPDWLTDHVIFVNLFLSSEDEHIARRHKRCGEREYDYSAAQIMSQVQQIRDQKNDMIHNDTILLSKYHSNVFSIDVVGKSQNEVVNEIMKLIYKYYDL